MRMYGRCKEEKWEIEMWCRLQDRIGLISELCMGGEGRLFVVRIYTRFQVMRLQLIRINLF